MDYSDLSDDLKRFKTLTNNHHIIMGRKTFESFPKPLPNRMHIVISRQNNYNVPNGVIVVNTLEDAIDATKKDSQPFIIGGGEIYKQTLNQAQRIYLTQIHRTIDGDTYYPTWDQNLFALKEFGNIYTRLMNPTTDIPMARMVP